MGINIPLDSAISRLRFYSTNKFAKECVPKVYIYIPCSISVTTKLNIAYVAIDEGLINYTILKNEILGAVKKNEVHLCADMERHPK